MSIEDIKRRAEAATPGPWEAEAGDVTAAAITAPNGYVLRVSDEWFDEQPWNADADFIAHARTDIPRLLAVVEAVAPAINGLLSTGWLMDSLTAEEGWSGEPNSHQWLYDAIVAAGEALAELDR